MRPSNLLWAQCCTMAWSESSWDFCTKTRSPKCNASNRSASRSANSCLEPQWLLNLAQRVTLTRPRRDFTQGEKSPGREDLCRFVPRHRLSSTFGANYPLGDALFNSLLRSRILIRKLIELITLSMVSHIRLTTVICNQLEERVIIRSHWHLRFRF